MPVDEDEVAAAEARMSALRDAGYAVAVRHERRHKSLSVTPHTGVPPVVPVGLLRGLADASPRALAEVEISPSGLGLHWPSIDADVHVPGLLVGVFGSAARMAALASTPSPASDRRSA